MEKDSSLGGDLNDGEETDEAANLKAVAESIEQGSRNDHENYGKPIARWPGLLLGPFSALQVLEKSVSRLPSDSSNIQVTTSVTKRAKNDLPCWGDPKNVMKTAMFGDELAVNQAVDKLKSELDLVRFTNCS